MLVLTIWTYEPGQREKLQQIAVREKGAHAAVKVLGKWHDVSGNKLFVLQEVEKASDLLQTNDPWLKYATAESYIVMEEKELLGMGEKYKFVSQTKA